MAENPIVKRLDDLERRNGEDFRRLDGALGGINAARSKLSRRVLVVELLAWSAFALGVLAVLR